MRNDPRRIGSLLRMDQEVLRTMVVGTEAEVEMEETVTAETEEEVAAAVTEGAAGVEMEEEDTLSLQATDSLETEEEVEVTLPLARPPKLQLIQPLEITTDWMNGRSIAKSTRLLSLLGMVTGTQL